MDDKISLFRHSSIKSIQMAKYLLATTYPLVKEPKTLLTISDHVLQSFMSSVSALLFFERSKKIIPPYHETNESKINAFKQHLVKKYKFEEYLSAMNKITNLTQHHKSSVVEFSRDSKYVMCSDQFSKIETISEKDVKDFISKAQDFVSKVNDVMANE